MNLLKQFVTLRTPPCKSMVAPSAAFAVATAKVWHAVQQHGLQRVFATLERPELW